MKIKYLGTMIFIEGVCETSRGSLCPTGIGQVAAFQNARPIVKVSATNDSILHFNSVIVIFF